MKNVSNENVSDHMSRLWKIHSWHNPAMFYFDEANITCHSYGLERHEQHIKEGRGWDIQVIHRKGVDYKLHIRSDASATLDDFVTRISLKHIFPVSPFLGGLWPYDVSGTPWLRARGYSWKVLKSVEKAMREMIPIFSREFPHGNKPRFDVILSSPIVDVSNISARGNQGNLSHRNHHHKLSPWHVLKLKFLFYICYLKFWIC